MFSFYRVIVKTRRCGGGFGAKITRSNFAACATALVAHKFNKPCRVIMPMTSITRTFGKRPNTRCDYEVCDLSYLFMQKSIVCCY